MRLTSLLLALCIAAAPALADDAQLERHFRGYIDHWTRDADIPAIVSEYWGARATMLPEGQPPVQLADQAAISAALAAAMQPVIEAGWQSSSVVAFSSCRLRDDLALVGIDYQRRYADGHITTDSAIYIVSAGEGGWRIQAVMGSETSALSC